MRIAITVNQLYRSVLIIGIFKLGFPNECAAVDGGLWRAFPLASRVDYRAVAATTCGSNSGLGRRPTIIYQLPTDGFGHCCFSFQVAPCLRVVLYIHSPWKTPTDARSFYLVYLWPASALWVNPVSNHFDFRRSTVYITIAVSSL